MSKQGRPDVSGPADRKTDPNSRIVNPGGANNIGRPHSNHATDGGTFTPNVTPLYGGKGYEAPPIRNINSRKGGSQGKY